MKFLIIVPTLNSYLLLDNLYKSLDKQNFKNWRVLFVDGNSNLKHKKWIKKICKENNKFTYKNQSKTNPGIFGAMNDGFLDARLGEWILFLGSDDWLCNYNSLNDLNLNLINLSNNNQLDIAICKAIYVDLLNKRKGRISDFGENAKKTRIIEGKEFRKMLYEGYSPAHQATIFGPNLKSKLFRYNTKFKLSADLEYFLKLSRYKNLKVALVNLNLIYMGSSGVSSKNTFQRLKEVIMAYFLEFKMFFLIVFIKRYLRKINSLINSSK